MQNDSNDESNLKLASHPLSNELRCLSNERSFKCAPGLCTLSEYLRQELKKIHKNGRQRKRGGLERSTRGCSSSRRRTPSRLGYTMFLPQCKSNAKCLDIPLLNIYVRKPGCMSASTFSTVVMVMSHCLPQVFAIFTQNATVTANKMQGRNIIKRRSSKTDQTWPKSEYGVRVRAKIKSTLSQHCTLRQSAESDRERTFSSSIPACGALGSGVDLSNHSFVQRPCSHSRCCCTATRSR